jgi:hypothetical protein
MEAAGQLTGFLIVAKLVEAQPPLTEKPLSLLKLLQVLLIRLHMLCGC